MLLSTLSDQLGAVYLRDADEYPEQLDVYRVMAESPIKLDWFLDHGTLLWDHDGTICCTAKDIRDHALEETFNYFYPGEPITYYLAPTHQIDRMLDGVRKERAIEDLFSGDDAKALREMAEEAPVIELVNNLLSSAVDLGASDIHVEPTEEVFVVRMRVDGVLHTRLTQPVDRFPAGGVADQAHRRDRHRPTPPPPRRRHPRTHLGPEHGHPGLHRAVHVRRVHRAPPA